MRYQRWIEIDRMRLNNNIRAIRNVTLNAPIIAMVKGNCYGLGLRTMVPLLHDNGVTAFGVVGIEEALIVRELCPKDTIINFESALIDDIRLFIQNNIVLSIMSPYDFHVISKYVTNKSMRVQVIVKINTGLNRWGCSVSDAISILKRLGVSKNITLIGLVTTLTENKQKDDEAIQIMNAFHMRAQDFGLQNLFLSYASSHAICSKKLSNFETIRPGISLWGIYPDNISMELRNLFLSPVFSLKSRVALVRKIKRGDRVLYKDSYCAIKDVLLGVVPIGYAQGYSSLFLGAYVLVRGVKCPVIGVSMSTTLINLSKISTPQKYEEVALIGEQKGNSITLEELSSISRLSPYAVMNQFSSNVPRVVLD